MTPGKENYKFDPPQDRRFEVFAVIAIILFFAYWQFKNSQLAETEVPASKTDTSQTVQPHRGNPAKRGGTATVRKAYDIHSDDPSTTNDESNDQPIGHFGDATVTVRNVSSGNSYDVDVDVDANEVTRIYFQKGGWVDMDTSDIDEDGNGNGTDEQGRDWEFEGYVRTPEKADDDNGDEDADS